MPSTAHRTQPDGILIDFNLIHQQIPMLTPKPTHHSRLTNSYEHYVGNFIKKSLQIKKTIPIFDIICQINIFKLKTTGEIIREKREKKGLLLRQVAALLDIDTAILSKVERGERKLNREQISKVADILELDKDAILIQYLSEKILYEIQDDDLGIQALKVAEKAMKYNVNRQSNK